MDIEAQNQVHIIPNETEVGGDASTIEMLFEGLTEQFPTTVVQEVLGVSKHRMSAFINRGLVSPMRNRNGTCLFQYEHFVKCVYIQYIQKGIMEKIHDLKPSLVGFNANEKLRDEEFYEYCLIKIQLIYENRNYHKYLDKLNNEQLDNY